MALHIDLAFFRGDDLICRGAIRCDTTQAAYLIEDGLGLRFDITSKYEMPAAPVEIICHDKEKKLYTVALRVGVHNSEDWESINLCNVHTLGFRCHELQ